MSTFEFMGAHPILTFFLACFIYRLCCWPFDIVNRLIRHLNIRKAGWPPEHLDADGDFHKDDAEEEESAQ